jgi:hypothetical protein
LWTAGPIEARHADGLGELAFDETLHRLNLTPFIQLSVLSCLYADPKSLARWVWASGKPSYCFQWYRLGLKQWRQEKDLDISRMMIIIMPT